MRPPRIVRTGARRSRPDPDPDFGPDFEDDLPDPEDFEYIDDDDATPGPIGDKSRRADD